jgi:hypothetical protein
MKPAFPSPQPKGRGVNVKQVMCRIRTRWLFPPILAGLSITCAPVQAQAAGIEPTFAGFPTAMPAEALGLSGALRPGAGL